MKGKIPLFLRLTLVVILAVSFSLVPMAVNPQPAAAAITISLSTLRATTAQANAGLPLWAASTSHTASTAVALTPSAGVYVMDKSYSNIGTPATLTITGTNTAATGTATVTAGGTLAAGTNTVTATTTGAGQTVTVTLATGVVGVAISGTHTVTGSPAVLAAGGATTVTISSGALVGGTFTIITGPSSVTSNARGDVVASGTYYNATTTAATITFTANDGIITAKTQTMSVATSVANQVKITSSNTRLGTSVVSYADPLQTGGDYARIFNFANVGDGITIETVSTTAHPVSGTSGDFLAGGALVLTFDNTVQTLLGNTTVDSNVTNAGVANANYRKFNSTFLIPETSGGTVTAGAGDAPGAGKTVNISDGVNKVFMTVYVAPRAYFSPNLGSKSANITVAGKGWAKNSTITVYSKATDPTVGSLGDAVVTDPATVKSDANGTFSAKFAALSNTSRISVQDGEGSQALKILRLDETGNTFSVKPTISVTPSTAKVGDTITLTGSEWGVSIPFKVFFGTEVSDYGASGYTPVVTGTTSALGEIAPITFTIPSTYGTTTSVGPPVVRDTTTTPGTYKVHVQDSGPLVGGVAAAPYTSSKDQKTTLTISPITLTVSPASAGRGTKLSISASGLTPSGTATATIAGAAFTTTTNTNTTITSGGTWASEYAIPANASLGSNVIVVTDTGNRRAEGSITVTGVTLTVNPTSAPRYGKVIVSGTNVILATTNTSIPAGQLTIGGQAWNTTGNSNLFVSGAGVATTGVVSMASDSFSATIRIPVGGAISAAAVDTGDVEIAVTDATGQKIGIGKVKVTQPTISVSPTSAVRNSIVTVTGKGWVPDESVTVYVGGAGTAANNTTSASATAQADGTFATTFKVPTTFSVDSTNNIGAADGKNNASPVATLRVPAATLTVSPSTAAVGQEITLKGDGFARNTEIQYGFPWNGIGAGITRTFSTAVYSTDAGSFTAKLVIPGRDAGTYSIGVADDTAATAATAIATIIITEAAKTVASALAPIASQLKLAAQWDAASQKWQTYDPTLTGELATKVNTLSQLTKNSVVWISVSAATTITTGGVTKSLVPPGDFVAWLD